MPFFGICFGMQMAVIEAMRNLAGIEGASSTEFGPCEHPVVGLLTEWTRGNTIERREQGGDLGGTMRLGAYPCVLQPGSLVRSIYDAARISERHRHRYEVNIRYKPLLEEKGLLFSGMSPDGLLPEIVELPGHPWFVGVQFHPGSEPAAQAPSAVRLVHRGGGEAGAAGVSGTVAMRPNGMARRPGRAREPGRG